jgi:hypothetical protein
MASLRTTALRATTTSLRTFSTIRPLALPTIKSAHCYTSKTTSWRSFSTSPQALLKSSRVVGDGGPDDIPHHGVNVDKALRMDSWVHISVMRTKVADKSLLFTISYCCTQRPPNGTSFGIALKPLAPQSTIPLRYYVSASDYTPSSFGLRIRHHPFGSPMNHIKRICSPSHLCLPDRATTAIPDCDLVLALASPVKSGHLFKSGHLSSDLRHY